MSDDPRIAAFVRDLEELRSEVRALKTPQLAHSAIVDGALAGWDDTEQIETMQIGLQYDGTNVAASLTGPKPPTPDAPTVAPGQNSGVVVTWNGIFVDDIVAPMDFARMDVHVGDAGVDETYPIANSILSARGGDAFVSLDPGEYWVVLVARAQNGKASVPSEAVSFTVASPAVSDGEAPSAVGTVTAQGMLGAVALRWAGVVNNDPVTYRIHGQRQGDGPEDFTVDEDNMIATTDGTYAVVRELANGALIHYDDTIVEQVTVDTLNRSAGGYVNCLTPEVHPWGVGDTVELAGVDGHPELDGAWQITSITFLGEDSQNFFQIRPTESATPIETYNPTATATRTIDLPANYVFKIVAIDADGAAEASPPVSCKPIRINSDDIAAYSITAEMLQAGAVTAESLAAEIVLSTRFLTAETGARVEFGPAGLAIYAPDGSLAFNFPTFSTNPEDPLTATVRAEIDALSIAVQDYLTLNGQENQINKGGRLRLSTGTTRPSKGSTPVVSWDSKPSHAGLSGRGLIKTGNAWYMMEYGGGLTRMSEQADRFVISGRWDMATTGVASSYNASSVIYLAGSLWAMTLAKDPYNQFLNYWRLRRYTYDAGADKWTQVGSGWRYTPGTVTGHFGIGSPVLFTDGTSLMTVQTNKNGHVNVMKAETSNPTTWTEVGSGLYAGPTTLWQPNEEMRAAVYGTEFAHPRTMTQYTKPAGSTAVITTSAAHYFNTGQKVKLTSSVFNGDFTIVSTTTNTFTISSTSGSIGGPFALLGTAQPYVLYTTREGKTALPSIANAWIQRSGGQWIHSVPDSFPLPAGSGNTGLVWDPTLAVLRSRFGESIYTHTNLSWTDEPSRWWSALTLYRGSGPYETETGPKTQFTPPKRSKVTLSHPALPPASIPPSSADPTAYRVYIARSEIEPARTEMDRIDELTTSPGTTVISSLPGFPASPVNYPPAIGDRPFPASTPAEIAPAANVGPAFLRGDGYSWLDPFGSTKEYGGSAPPEGWLWCDGSVVSRALYPRLFEAIGTQFNTGGETSDQFRLPLRNGTDAQPTLLTPSGWDVADEFGVMMSGGRVYMNGTCRRSPAPANGATVSLGTLATDWRPGKPIRFAVTGETLAGALQGKVAVDGSLSIVYSTGSTVYLGFSGASWRPANWRFCTGTNYILRAA